MEGSWVLSMLGKHPVPGPLLIPHETLLCARMGSFLNTEICSPLFKLWLLSLLNGPSATAQAGILGYLFILFDNTDYHRKWVKKDKAGRGQFQALSSGLWAPGSGFQALGSRPLGGTEGFFELLALVRKQKEAEAAEG